MKLTTVNSLLLMLFCFSKPYDCFADACFARNAFAENMCTNAKSENQPKNFIRHLSVEHQGLERESRIINVRERVGTERLVNNRRIVDSDSRITNFPSKSNGKSANMDRIYIARNLFTDSNSILPNYSRIDSPKIRDSQRTTNNRLESVTERTIRVIRDNRQDDTTTMSRDHDRSIASRIRSNDRLQERTRSTGHDARVSDSRQDDNRIVNRVSRQLNDHHVVEEPLMDRRLLHRESNQMRNHRDNEYSVYNSRRDRMITNNRPSINGEPTTRILSDEVSSRSRVNENSASSDSRQQRIAREHTIDDLQTTDRKLTQTDRSSRLAPNSRRRITQDRRTRGDIRDSHNIEYGARKGELDTRERFSRIDIRRSHQNRERLSDDLTLRRTLKSVERESRQHERSSVHIRESRQDRVGDSRSVSRLSRVVDRGLTQRQNNHRDRLDQEQLASDQVRDSRHNRERLPESFRFTARDSRQARDIVERQSNQRMAIGNNDLRQARVVQDRLVNRKLSQRERSSRIDIRDPQQDRVIEVRQQFEAPKIRHAIRGRMSVNQLSRVDIRDSRQIRTVKDHERTSRTFSVEDRRTRVSERDSRNNEIRERYRSASRNVNRELPQERSKINRVPQAASRVMSREQQMQHMEHDSRQREQTFGDGKKRVTDNRQRVSEDRATSRIVHRENERNEMSRREENRNRITTDRSIENVRNEYQERSLPMRLTNVPGFWREQRIITDHREPLLSERLVKESAGRRSNVINNRDVRYRQFEDRAIHGRSFRQMEDDGNSERRINNGGTLNDEPIKDENNNNEHRTVGFYHMKMYKSNFNTWLNLLTTTLGFLLFIQAVSTSLEPKRYQNFRNFLNVVKDKVV